MGTAAECCRKRGGWGSQSPGPAPPQPCWRPGGLFPHQWGGCELCTAGVSHPSTLLCILFIHSLNHSSLIPSSAHSFIHSFNLHAWCTGRVPGSGPQPVSLEPHRDQSQGDGGAQAAAEHLQGPAACSQERSRARAGCLQGHSTCGADTGEDALAPKAPGAQVTGGKAAGQLTAATRSLLGSVGATIHAVTPALLSGFRPATIPCSQGTTLAPSTQV